MSSGAKRQNSASARRDPPNLSYLSPAAIRGNSSHGTRPLSPATTYDGRPSTAPGPHNVSPPLSPVKHKSKFRGTTFLKDMSQNDNVLPRPLPQGITYAATFASFEELMERNILEQRQEHLVSLSTDDVSAIYHAKCMDQRLPPSWEREARFMELLSQNCKGRFFELKENGLGPYATSAVCQVLARNTMYSILDLSGNRLRDAGAEYIAGLLLVNKTLVHVSLRSNDIGVEGGRAIADALARNNTLTSLDLSGISGINRNHLGSKGAEEIGIALGMNRTLCVLNIGSNGLGSRGMELLKSGLEHNESLTSLNLSSNNLGPEGCAILADVFDACNIRHINLDRNAIGDRGCIALANALRPPHFSGERLETLSIAQNGVRSLGIEQLARALPSAVMLKVLVIEENHCGEGGYQLALAMRDNRSITEWHMHSCGLQQEHAEKMGEALGFNHAVEVLDISRNSIGDRGAIPVLKSLQNHQRIRVLNLDNIGTTDEVGKHIAALVGSSKTLQELRIRQNNIKESGDVIAEVLKRNTRLILLDALFNDFSYKAFSCTEAYIARNRKTWNHNEVPRLTQEISDLNNSEKDLTVVLGQIDAERRSIKEKMDEGYRRKEGTKTIIEDLRKRNAELDTQWNALKAVSGDLTAKYDDLSEMVEREKGKMDGKQNVTESKRRMEEDKKNDFFKQRDKLEKKLKEFLESEAEAFKGPREEVKKLEEERDRERGDARTQAEHLVSAELKLLELQIICGLSVHSGGPPGAVEGDGKGDAGENSDAAAPTKASPPSAPAPGKTKQPPKGGK